jgi:uncharacterized protein YdhG (YjbR/CyaY superfamily)
MQEKTHYQNGQKIYESNGNRLTYFYKSGKIKAEGIYENEMMQGEWKFYDEAGALIQTGHFKDHKKEGLWERYEKGRLTYRETFVDNKIVKNKEGVPAKKDTPENIDVYIAGFPEDVRERMNHIRRIIHEAAPGVEEKISWGMPSFKMGKTWVQFAAFKNHIGFYPGPSAIGLFAEELTAYKTSKGAIRFPYKEPVPADLISRIVRFRLEESIGAGLAPTLLRHRKRDVTEAVSKVGTI